MILKVSFVLVVVTCSNVPIATAEKVWLTGISLTTVNLKSVFMVDTNDGWVVSKEGIIFHWNGTLWSTVTSPTTEPLWSIFMVSADDGWAVGYGGTIIHWDGTSWNPVPSPTTSFLRSVFMVSADEGWIMGEEGTILHWNGASWSNFTSPTTEWLESVYLVNATDGWAVGWEGTIIHWNGISWSEVPSPTTQWFMSVFMVSAEDGWAVADYGTIAHWNGTLWSTVTSPAARLESVFMVSADDGWAVGGDGTILHWNGTSWSTVTSPTTSWLCSVHMVSANDGWAVGLDGTVIRLNGGESPMPYDYPFMEESEWSKSPSTINCSVSPTSIARGSDVTISGAISPGHPAQLTIQYSTDGGATWSTLANITSALDGSYTYTWRPPQAINYKIRAYWEGDADYHGATSDVVTVTVTAKIDHTSYITDYTLYIIGVIIAAVLGIATLVILLKRRTPQYHLV